MDFCAVQFFLRFPVGRGSEFQAEVAYLEVGRLDFEQIYVKHIFMKFMSESSDCSLKGIGVRDYYAFEFFFLLAGRFSIGCGSKSRAKVAYLEVGSSDLGQIHEKHVFR